jgi:hypothetical protein
LDDGAGEAAPPLGLFEGYGIEIEYAIVDAGTLDVRPLADALIEAECGRVEGEIARGAMAWSNELARHVIELKTAAPVATLSGVAASCAGRAHRDAAGSIGARRSDRRALGWTRRGVRPAARRCDRRGRPHLRLPRHGGQPSACT